jgi:Dolichyl-phosphate-mannose-protein mannosyltransferase
MFVYKKIKIWKILSSWLIINILQSFFTGLHYDEAYYFMYSRRLDWGYFDHPPMVALFIKIGYSLFQNEFGLRLLTVVASTFTLWLTWDLISAENKEKNAWIFALLVGSMFMLNGYAFITTPDVPLLVFGTLFLWLYRRFLADDSLLNAVFLGITAGLLLYGKYHGILLIGFVFLSNWKLIKKPTFYVAVLLGILCFIPHLIWQFTHQFPSITYHLFGRTEAKPYKLAFTLEYLPNQLVIFGPFIVYFLVKSVLKSSTKNIFERSLKFVFWGFLSFFFLMTFKGHVEPHWTVFASIPALIFAFNYYASQEIKQQNQFKIFGTIGVVLVLIARLLIAGEVFKKVGIQNGRPWATAIQRAANGKPVVFLDSYQKASIYTFYTGEEAHCLHTYNNRSSQFDEWNVSEKFKNKEVLFIKRSEFPTTDSVIISTPENTEIGFIKNQFTPYNLCWYKILEQKNNQLSIEFFNATEEEIPASSLQFYLEFSTEKPQKFVFSSPLKQGTNNLIFLLKNNETTNNQYVKIAIQEKGMPKLLLRRK